MQLLVLRGCASSALASPANVDWLGSHGAEPISYGDGLAERLRARGQSASTPSSISSGPSTSSSPSISACLVTASRRSPPLTRLRSWGSRPRAAPPVDSRGHERNSGPRRVRCGGDPDCGHVSARAGGRCVRGTRAPSHPREDRLHPVTGRRSRGARSRNVRNRPSTRPGPLASRHCSLAVSWLVFLPEDDQTSALADLDLLAWRVADLPPRR